MVLLSMSFRLLYGTLVVVQNDQDQLGLGVLTFNQAGFWGFGVLGFWGYWVFLEFKVFFKEKSHQITFFFAFKDKYQLNI